MWAKEVRAQDLSWLQKRYEAFSQHLSLGCGPQHSEKPTMAMPSAHIPLHPVSDQGRWALVSDLPGGTEAQKAASHLLPCTAVSGLAVITLQVIHLQVQMTTQMNECQ